MAAEQRGGGSNSVKPRFSASAHFWKYYFWSRHDQIFRLSGRRQRQNSLERLPGGATQLDNRKSLPDLLDGSAGLEEDVVGSVHP